MNVVATRSESLVSFLPFPTKIEVGGRILMKASEFCKIRPLFLKPSSIKVLTWIFSRILLIVMIRIQTFKNTRDRDRDKVDVHMILLFEN